MTLSTNSQIKATILDDWEQVSTAKYPEDLLTEFVDSELPIYYGDIINEWRDLTNLDSNRFNEIMEITPTTTIYDLMLADLFLYYHDQFNVAYKEILNEKENQEC